MEYLKPPDEYASPPEEFKTPPEEYALPENEFYGQKPVKRAAEEDNRHRRLLRMILIPVAAAAGAIALLFASIGYDPLGGDFLGAHADATETPSSDGTPEPTEPPIHIETPEPTATPEPTPVPEGDWDDAFPELDNLDPDFEGEYSWSGTGRDNSEEYIRVIETGNEDYTFIVMGGAWAKMTDSNGNPNTVKTVEGLSYDRETNTLTMTDFTGEELDVNLMGNGFTIRLEGENRIGKISVWGAMYGGSLTIRGPGKLTVTGAGSAPSILLNAESSGSCLMIAGDATVDIYGEYTIAVVDTTLSKALYYLMPIDMTGGTMQLVDTDEATGYGLFMVLDENGEISHHVTFTPRWVIEEPDPE